MIVGNMNGAYLLHSHAQGVFRCALEGAEDDRGRSRPATT
jgi:hypothetical protein